MPLSNTIQYDPILQYPILPNTHSTRPPRNIHIKAYTVCKQHLKGPEIHLTDGMEFVEMEKLYFGRNGTKKNWVLNMNLT